MNVSILCNSRYISPLWVQQADPINQLQEVMSDRPTWANPT
ncbi:hypothetical protein [Allocoleopsis franciscana]|nr:hypothetical protein [Allocoleopsis franciscana]